MPFTKLQDVWTSINTLYSASGVSLTSDISMQEAANITGVDASIPDITPSLKPKQYRLNNFNALNTNLDNTYSIDGNLRYMEDGTMGDAGLNSTFFIVNAGNYTVRSFMSGTTTIKVNNTTTGVINVARGTFVLSNLSIGDRVTFNRPCTIDRSAGSTGAQPGILGAYGGYGGFSFATRIDRYSPIMYIFNLDQNEAIYEIMLTTSTGNVSSMTSVQNGSINSGDYVSYSPGNGNYFIQSDKLVCIWRGGASQDTCMLFPLTLEPIYGWYSSNGHTFAANNAGCTRINAAGGDGIAGTATNAANASFGSPSTGDNTVLISDSAPATVRGGNYFSGNGCAVYNDQMPNTSGRGTLLAAESQADGNGGEQTTFTSVKAHARGAMSSAGSAWNAFISAGFSGSTPSQPLYSDVIMRFNSAGTFQEAKAFQGQSIQKPFSSKSYFGNGAGSGTSASAGDFFWSTTRVQGYQDTDASKKDETNMIMSATITLPVTEEHQIRAQTDPYAEGFPDAQEACSSRGSAAFFVYSPSVNLALGTVVFIDANATYNKPFNGLRTWYKLFVGAQNYAIQIDYNGTIIGFQICP